MPHHPGSAHFLALFKEALKAYEQRPDVSLADMDDQLSARIMGCDTVEAITHLLQDRVRASRIYKVLKS